jgi:hypothetical protein
MGRVRSTRPIFSVSLHELRKSYLICYLPSDIKSMGFDKIFPISLEPLFHANLVNERLN